MPVRRIVVTCLAGALGVSAIPAGALTLPGAIALADVPAAAPATAAWGQARLAPSLLQLRAEVDARWPNRGRASDGWLGDSYHQASRSDHNPVGHVNGPSVGTPGVVHALDITARGIDPAAVVAAVVGDSRVWYVIYNRTIWSRSYGWRPRPFSGDSHTTHIHISLRDDSQSAAVRAERDTRRWLPPIATPASLTGAQIRTLQRALIGRGFAIPAGATGFFGGQTKAAVAAFQRSQGWTGSGADGVPGAETLRRLGITAAPAVTYAVQATSATRSSTAAPAVSSSYVPGARGSHISAMQRALIARGMSIPSGPTGLFGSETRAAVAAFQRSQGWGGSGADGVPGPATLARLGITGGSASGPAVMTASVAPSATATTAGSYVPGARGSHISAMQRALIARGMSIPSGPTGLFGSETRAAVAAFQRSQGWGGSGADGVPGPATLARLGITGGASSGSPVRTISASRTPATATTGSSYALGARGAHIVWLQRALLANGIAIPSGATGWFGPETKAAVAAFQRAQGWSGSGANGVPGSLTLRRLGLR